METLTDLAERWLEEAELLERYGDSPAAAACRLHAEELRAALASAADDLLSLKQAAEASGYAERSLRQMVAEGRIENRGRKNAPRLRRGDLPMKPGAQRPQLGSYDPSADARQLLRGTR